MAFLYCPKCEQAFDPTITPPKREVGKTKLHRIYCPLCGLPSPAIEFAKNPLPEGAGIPLNTQKMKAKKETLGPDGKKLTPSQKWVLDTGINMFPKGGKGIPINVPQTEINNWMLPRTAAKIAQAMDEKGDYISADIADSIILSEP